jgi:uncharacterized protein YcgI (DUF1989 family)
VEIVVRLTDFQLAVLQKLRAQTGTRSWDSLLAAAVEHDRDRGPEPRRQRPRPGRGSGPRTPSSELRLDAVLPAASGAALALAPGHTLWIEQLDDGQGVDLRTFEGGGRSFSAARTRAEHGIHPTTGSSLWSAPPERPLLTITTDTAASHDLLFPPCSEQEYTRFSGVPGHLGCEELHAEALTRAGMEADHGTDVLNLWLPSAVAADGSLRSWPAVCRSGDRIALDVHEPVTVTLTTCPDDVFGTSQYEPKPVRVRVAGGPRGALRAGGWPLHAPPQSVAGTAIELAPTAAAYRHLSTTAANGWLGYDPATVARALMLGLHEALATSGSAAAPA